MRKSKIAVVGMIIGIVLTLTGCGGAPVKKTAYYLDSVIEVDVKVKKKKDSVARVEKILDQSFEQIVALDTCINKMSPISEISAVNANAPYRTVDTSPLLYDLIKKAVMGSLLADGYFSVTWQPLADLFQQNNVQLDRINRIKNGLSYENIQLDKSLERVRLGSAYTKLDFDHLKRGYAVDMVVKDLSRNKMIKSGSVKASNVIYYFGTKRITMKYGNKLQAKFKVKNGGVATITTDDEYYANAVFWKKYLPVETTEEEIEAVTVIAPNATTAEVLVNAFYFMGTEKSLEKIKELKSKVRNRSLYNVIFVVKKGETKEIVSSLRR
jgi:thiamine biosynthesis lipoprotein